VLYLVYLTKEKAILDGKYGEASRITMSVLVELGEMYGANRMIEVQHVHIDAASYATIHDSSLHFCEKLAYTQGQDP